MSTTAKEMVEYHKVLARLYAAAAKRYPDATLDRFDGADVLTSYRIDNYDHIRLSRDTLVPCVQIKDDATDEWILVLGRHGRPAVLGLEFLKEKHPEAYAGLIQWLVRG